MAGQSQEKNTLGCHKANLFFLPPPWTLAGNAVRLEGGQSSSLFSRLKLIVGANREDRVDIPARTVAAGSADPVTKAAGPSPAPTRRAGGAVPGSGPGSGPGTRGPGLGWGGEAGCSAAGSARARPGPALGQTPSPGPRAARPRPPREAAAT